MKEERREEKGKREERERSGEERRAEIFVFVV